MLECNSMGEKYFYIFRITLLFLHCWSVKMYGYIVPSKPEGYAWPSVTALFVFQGNDQFTACLVAITSSWWTVIDACFYSWQEFPFFTLTAFPPGFLVHVGGVVSARSVKLLDRIHNPGTLTQYISLSSIVMTTYF